MAAPPIKQFEGASFISTDIEASLHFWCDFVGAELIGEGDAEGRVPWRVALGGVVLEFYPAAEGQQPSPGTNGQHYCWDCEPTEFDFWIERGLAWQMRPKHIGVHANGKELSLYWDDPDGYHLEVAAHYCTNVELMKARAVRTKRFNELNALPDDPFTKDTQPSRQLTATRA
jgi:catechol 2,3-dioxygenase-like lactoylglutathione lyase family enzyme